MKAYNIVAPKVIDDVDDIFNAFMIAKNMTGDLRTDLASYTKKQIRYTDPFSNDFYQASEDYWHIPLFSVGNVDGNNAFARVSVKHTDPSTLYVAFRPMNLDGLFESLKGRMVEATAKFNGMTSVIPSQDKSLDNLIQITRVLDDTTTKNGITSGLYNILMQSDYKVIVENWFSTLGKKTKSNPFKAHFAKEVPAIFRHDPDTASSFAVSIVQAITTFVHFYQPKEVIFTGFSYGSSLAMSASILTKYLLMENAKSPHVSVYQFAGSKVCDKQGQRFASEHLNKVVYVGLTRNHTINDPVTALPSHSINLVHVGNQYCIDVLRHTVKPTACIATNTNISMKSLVYNYVMKQRGAETFKSIHLAGEDLLERILLTYMIDNNMKSNIIDLESIPCEFFSSTGYSAKYKVCPRKFCISVSVTTDGKIKNKCNHS